MVCPGQIPWSGNPRSQAVYARYGHGLGIFHLCPSFGHFTSTLQPESGYRNDGRLHCAGCHLNATCDYSHRSRTLSVQHSHARICCGNLIQYIRRTTPMVVHLLRRCSWLQADGPVLFTSHLRLSPGIMLLTINQNRSPHINRLDHAACLCSAVRTFTAGFALRQLQEDNTT